jgi:DNA adenine methylase
LLRKKRVHTEIYNDLDSEVVNLFRVMRDPIRAKELVRLIALTPYSRSEYEDSYLAAADPVEQARRTLVRSFMGYGSVATTSYSGFRTGSRLSGASAACDWARLPTALEAVVERFRGVIIDNRPATEVMVSYDSRDALHYLDPPYLLSTRNVHSVSNCVYRFEMSEDDHRYLAEVVHRLKGGVVISGYPSSLYDEELYVGWQRFTKATKADSGAERTEVIWVSPNIAVQRGLELVDQE